jgi:hypothetical protein
MDWMLVDEIQRQKDKQKKKSNNDILYYLCYEI